MSIKESSERIRETATVMKRDFRTMTQNLLNSFPRPIKETLTTRPTIILRKPLIKTLTESARKQP